MCQAEKNTLGIIDKVITLVRERGPEKVQVCGRIMEMVGRLKGGVPTPEEWYMFRSFQKRSFPLLPNLKLYLSLCYPIENNK